MLTTKTKLLFVVVLNLLMAQAVQANIEVNFFESAPKDRFEITNVGDCNLQDLTLRIDLSRSNGRLIFDTTASGAGVDVYQPFEAGTEGIELVSASVVKDGDADLSLNIESLPPGKAVSFTIDVDDTLPTSELGPTRISGSEIENGLVEISSGEQATASAMFDADNKAIITLSACT